MRQKSFRLFGGLFTAGLLFGLLISCASKQEPADLVLVNGKIVTVDESLPEAEALAVRGGRIEAVGDEGQIRAYIGGDTEVIDLGGKLAVPGFIDAHVHFTGIGQAKLGLNLMNAENWDAILGLVGAAVSRARPGEWIFGRGWHQEKWDEIPEPNVDGLPYHDNLSRLSPDNPVLLSHASGHASYANAKAMELAGVTKGTPDPPGGSYGEPWTNIWNSAPTRRKGRNGSGYWSWLLRNAWPRA
jgi:predicted amidohydrolase YtcJ